MNTRRLVRVAFLVVIVGSLLVMTMGYLGAAKTSPYEKTGESVAEPRDNITVIATDSNSWLGRESEGLRANAELIAIDEQGEVLYYNDSHTRYWDVDPVEGTTATVEYVYADHLTAEECGGSEVCTRNGMERVNLTTGEVTPIYSRVTAGKHSTRWHDIDRVNETHILVADIAQDRVFEVNTETGIVTWSWDAQSAFEPAKTGGPYPEDWTHINDVELLSDGTVMVSLRNHDQVAFIDREKGLLENRTLGSEDDYEVLYEQHNPDYIPDSEGGPAVLVGDSENNRVVEYQRVDGSWERTWHYRDGRTKWPRDADRLPNGHTLITASNGNRVFEVDKSGSVVWSVDVAFPYEAERLGTGDESAGGPSAKQANLESHGSVAPVTENGGGSKGLVGSVKSKLSGPLMNSVRYVLPVWFGPGEILAAWIAIGAIVGWAVVEWRWSGRRLSVSSPISVERDR